MSDFLAPVDIANRALQHCGAKRINSFSDIGINASETSFCYDKLRKAELQRTYWTFAIKHTILRAVDGNTMLLVPSLWSSATTYFVGSIVADEDGFLWESTVPNNLNNDPLLTTFWQPYGGPMGVPLWDTSGNTAYFVGELVYTTPGDGTWSVYRSLIDSNSDNPATATAWSATTTYFKNQVVTFNSVAYMSLVDLNLNKEPDTNPSQWTTTFTGGSGSVNWLLVGGSAFPSGVALQTPNILYPYGTGPATQFSTKNIYILPGNHLRKAPQNPKKGIPYLGGPTGVAVSDWLIEGRYLLTWSAGPIPYRFVADFTDVTRMHAMFCEGIGLRVGLEVCPKVTQSEAKAKEIEGKYQKWMTEAREVDAIENEYVDPPDDDYIACRY